jgi:signal transduction histidine kinase
VQIIGQTAREALAELRRLLGVLRGPAGVAGGRASTSPSPSISELDEVLVPVRQAGIAVDLRVEGSPAKLAPGVDLTAYRIVQEALTNTVRHSGANEAAVTISYEPGYLTVSVTDTGRGPAAAAAVGAAVRVPVGAAVGAAVGAPVGAAVGEGAGRPAEPAQAGLADAPDGSGVPSPGPGGWGLAGIVERVASCGGSLTIGPGETGGFGVKARLPV